MYPFEHMYPCKPCYPVVPKPMLREASTKIIGYGTLPPYMKMGHAYVPYQFLANIFSPDAALQKGTIFPDLYQPYVKKHHKRGYGL